MGRRFSNRAVSQIIGALLLIAITVTAAVLLYAFAMGLIGSLGTGGAQNIKEQLVMEGYNFPTTGPLVLSVRDIGPSSVNIGKADFFINGLPATMTGACAATSTITPTQSCAATIALSSGYSSLISGAAYPLRIVTPDGGVFSYPIIYGGAA